MINKTHRKGINAFSQLLEEEIIYFIWKQGKLWEGITCFDTKGSKCKEAEMKKSTESQICSVSLCHILCLKPHLHYLN